MMVAEHGRKFFVIVFAMLLATFVGPIIIWMKQSPDTYFALLGGLSIAFVTGNTAIHWAYSKSDSTVENKAVTERRNFTEGFEATP